MSKKKVSYSIDQLLLKAGENVNDLKPDIALKFFEKALAMGPERTDIMFSMIEIHLELGQVELAHKLITKSLELEPESNPMCWMYLGQMLGGKEALECFNNGVRLMKKEMETCMIEDRYNLLGKQVINGLVAAAELYLTDLCYEEEAEVSCESLLKEALSLDSNGVEALQSFASMRMSQLRREEAEEVLLKVVSIYQESEQEELPPYAFRVATVKMLIEVEFYDKAIDILENLLLENDEETEVWYLASHCYKACKDFTASREYGERCKKMIDDEIKECRKNKVEEEELAGLAEQVQLIEALLSSIEGLETNEDEEEKVEEMEESMED